MATSVSLSRMVDLALGTPELGAVNFNVLHTLLHAVLNKMDLQNVKADINEFDKDFLMRKSKSEPELGNIKEGAERDDADSAITGMTDGGLTDADRAGSVASIPFSKPPYHQLEEKVAKLEEQMEALNQMPSNKSLFERSKGDGEKIRPVSDLWQTMQIQKRVDTNEEGVGKLMSLVEDLMSEMQTLKAENDKMRKEMEKRWKDYLEETANKKPPTPPPSEPNKDLDAMMKKLKHLEDVMDKLAKDLSAMPGPDEWGNFVTWESLEKALRGLREDMKPGERVVIEMNTQTDLPSRAVSRASTPGPSAELMEILERLGTLTEKHDMLEQRVKELEEQLKNKADVNMLDGLSVPDDLLKQLKDIQDQLDAMRKGRDKVETLERTLYDYIAEAKEKESAPEKKTSDDVTITPTRSDEGHQEMMKVKSFFDMSKDCEELSKRMDKLEQSLKSFLEQFGSLPDQLEPRFGDIEDQLAEVRSIMYPESPVGELPESSTLPDTAPISDDKLPRPGSTNDERNIKDLENALSAKDSEMKHLAETVKQIAQESNKQLIESRDKLKTLESELGKMSESLSRVQEIRKKSSANIRRKSSADVVVMATDNQDSDAVARMQQAILQLQAELERLSNTTQNLVDENNNKTKDIESLYKICNGLEEKKADKEFVQSEVEVKADKRQLEGKVNRTLFDSTTEELNKMINDILNKLAGNEDEWKSLLDQMSKDLDGKLDRLEFGPWRDELERQLKALAKKLQGMNFPGPIDDDDAAGIRKQLIQRFNCISCDRPVDMLPQGPIPSIPAPQGMPANRSARPYTTFELEQIRQHARSGLAGRNVTNYERALIQRQLAKLRMHDFRSFVVHFGKDLGLKLPPIRPNYTNPQIDVMDLYQTSRACGGNHTLTFPNKRLTRLTQLNNLFREETEVPTFTKEEQDIQGADGHIYKGRHEQGMKLPNLNPQQMNGGSPKLSRKVQQAPRPPQNTGTPRPMSSRMTGRPQSGGLGERPTSAGGKFSQHPRTEVPVARSVGSPPPPPAPSEPDPRDMLAQSPNPTPAQN